MINYVKVHTLLDTRSQSRIASCPRHLSHVSALTNLSLPARKIFRVLSRELSMFSLIFVFVCSLKKSYKFLLNYTFLLIWLFWKVFFLIKVDCLACSVPPSGFCWLYLDVTDEHVPLSSVSCKLIVGSGSLIKPRFRGLLARLFPGWQW